MFKDYLNSKVINTFATTRSLSFKLNHVVIKSVLIKAWVKGTCRVHNETFLQKDPFSSTTIVGFSYAAEVYWRCQAYEKPTIVVLENGSFCRKVKVLDTVHNFLYFVTIHKRAISSVACASSHKFHPQRYRVYTLTLLSKVRFDTTNVW